MTIRAPRKSLTEEQRQIVDLPVDTMLLVTAGAGAGKTHTMVHRVARLLADDEVLPHEVLVLSFARSAVGELSRRLDLLGAGGRSVPVRTFDAFALDLLMDLDGGHDWVSEDFDDRIAAAATLIDQGAAAARLEELRHLVVDEAQDLVGVRLQLVAALLSETGCGFTVVGDAAQSIYGFQVTSDAERRRSADACFRMLRESLPDDLVERDLTCNFRARTDDSRRALPYGPSLRRAAEAEIGESGSYEDLRTTLMGALLLGPVRDPFTLAGLAGPDSTTAVLCRSNGEALVVAEHLADAGVAHRIRRTAQDRVAPAWLAAVFRIHHGTHLSRDAWDELVGELHLRQDSDLVWRQLIRVAGDRARRTVDMGRLRDAIGGRRLPDEFTAEPPADLVVSTFHRAKGLEFDRVVVVDPGPLRENSDTPEAEEARLLYVAMTRARDELWRLEAIRSFKVRRDVRTGRYARFGRHRGHRFGLEIGGQDVSALLPGGEDDPVAVQRMLRDVVRVGDSVELQLVDHPSPMDPGPTYRVVHGDRTIGTTSETFARSVFRALGGRKDWRPGRYPRLITGVRIDAVETVAGSAAAGSRAGLGDRGIWLAPRLVGLSTFEWSRDHG